MTFVFCAIAGADNPYDFVRILCDAQHLAIMCRSIGLCCQIKTIIVLRIINNEIIIV